jgi:hypothetical protein
VRHSVARDALEEAGNDSVLAPSLLEAAEPGDPPIAEVS